MNILKSNTKSSKAVSSKEIGLEVNTKKTKYMCSCHIIRMQAILHYNRCENLAELKYLGVTTNQKFYS
jgi:hypothetical protein